MHSVRTVLSGALIVIVASAACSPAQTRPSATPRPAPTRAAAVASPARSPVAGGASPLGSPVPETGDPLTIGGLVYNSFGFRDALGDARRDLDAGDFYFKGTFIRGEPNQKLTLRIRNTGSGAHNISIPSQGVDRELPTGSQRTDVEVTFPDSGALRFFCKIHESQGMNGQLLVGDAEPQPVAGAELREVPGG